MSSILLNKNGVPHSGTVMVRIECEVNNFSDAINLQLAVERRSKSVTLLEVMPIQGAKKKLVSLALPLCTAPKRKVGRPKGKKNSKPRKQGSSSKALRKETNRLINKAKKESAASRAKDSRAVWKNDSKQNRTVLNAAATLKNLGLSEGQLMAMPTKMGTLENSLKCTISANRQWATTL
jgi:hypothetical protein|tara:strand:- start:432 stop:968 length:537 start_codon:yes stop_codon:yes gene_type:complete